MIPLATNTHGRWKHMFYGRETIPKQENLVKSLNIVWFWLCDILGNSNTEDSEKTSDCQGRGRQSDRAAQKTSEGGATLSDIVVMDSCQ